MALRKVKLGQFVMSYDMRCGIADLGPEDVSGVNRDKEFFEPSNQVGADTSGYKVVPPGYYACNLMHVGRDKVLPIAMNHSNENKVVSPAYTVFSFDGHECMLSEYFFVLLKSEERDRYFWFNTDGSVRDGMSWADFCSVEVELPPIEIQRKYVAVYEAMLENQRSYERGLDDLKLTCDGYIEKLMHGYRRTKLAGYLYRHDCRNKDNSIKNVKGVSTAKEFREPTAKVDRNNLGNYKIVRPGWFSCVQTTHNEKCFAFAMNDTDKDIVVTSVNEVFSVNSDELVPEYLAAFFRRREFDRYARFHSWGSARETFSWVDLQDVEIPIPDIKTQRAIADIYKVYRQRSEINERLKTQLKDICPILIKGSIDEARAS